MIEFLSFFLVLATGPRPVELAVAGPMATVELRLDGRPVATIAGEPWSTLCDLGSELAPRELTAIARDAEGRELDRATQWINVGAQSSGATMSFEGDTEGRPRAVGVRWESIGRRQPQAIEVAFDGEPLEVSDPERVVLPPYDPESLHFVSAAVRFSDRLVTRLDAGFGGVYTDSVASELTAVPVILGKGARAPRPEELRSAFLKDGERLEVHGFEKTGAEIFVVRDPASQPHFASMIQVARRRRPTFGDDVRLYFLSPRPDLMSPGVVTSEVFPRSPRYPAGDDGLLFLTVGRPAVVLAGQLDRLRPAAPPPATESPAPESLAEPLPEVEGEPGLIEFFSRRDGLVTGPQRVELSVVGPVAGVEIRLDRRTVGTLSAEPWTLEADLGHDLAPHRLAALARDRDGRELERTERWLNLAPRNLFNFTGPYTPVDGDVLDLVHRISARAAHRLADVVAVAARELQGSGRRRAVVVLLGDERPDESLFTAAQVRTYLRALQVPVFIWSAAPVPPRPHREWGAARRVSSRHEKQPLANFEIAAAELRRHLESQRIVHLAGRHLPQSIALTEEAAAARLRLAGHEPLIPGEGTP
jgi:hypothetical protein